MKTLDYVKSQLQDAIKLGESELSKREAKQCEKEIKHLYSCQLYLETNPTEEFITKQQKDVINKIKAINGGYQKWCSANTKERDSTSNPKAKYNTMMGLKNLKAQLSTLNYLLS